MALCQFPLNLHTISSSTSSSPQFRRLQPLKSSIKPNFFIRRLRFRSFNHPVRFHTRELSVIRATIDIDTHQRKKTKRKPKPGFFEEINDKWSSRISPKTEKLPWQRQEEQIQHLKDDEDEEEDESSSNLSSGYGLSGKSTDSNRLYSANEPSTFPRPSGYMSAPWVNNGGSKGVNFTTSFEQGVESSSFDDVITVDRYRRDNDSSNRGVDSDLDDGERGMIDSGKDKGIWKTRRSNTAEAERVVPEHELRRLRIVALRMVERVKVGSAGITQVLVQAIHEKWEVDEVVKLKFGEPFSLNMKRTHEVLEKKTGGLVIWRSGSSVVLYRGISYKLKCVQTFIKQNNLDTKHVEARDYVPEDANYPKNVPKEQLSELCELNDLLDELGPRFHDWTGCAPFPVDADLLPGYVEGYRCPFRILPQGVKPCLSNTEMTEMRRLARTSPPHFALGRSRELQGLAKAMVKLWAKSAIAKIAIKRGVENTRNERMAEELKRLTRGVLVSRNKEYIVFYRGNDFMPPAVAEALTERQKEITEVLQTKEDQAREMASTRVTLTSQAKSPKTQLLAGTLAETIAASSRWAPDASSVDIEELKRESASIKRAALIRDLELRLLYKKTGGLVIWRSGSSVVLYRGISYKLKCVQTFIKQNNLDTKHVEARDYVPEDANYPKNVPKEQLSELCELNDLLDELGPRFHDWTGCAPFPVDADLLPGYVEGYRCPFRILPQGVKPCLSNTEMTEMRRLARTSPPHFALGRSRELQGLAKAMVKLWAKSAIAKIAIKRGVENTRNERMAEELKRLTRGVLVSRNKEYIVFYRGNDFMPPAVAEALTERQKEITEVLQTKEDQAREMASTRVTLTSQAKSPKTQLLAGTLAETIAASSRWAPDASSVDIEELKRESASIKRAALIRDLELRLLYKKTGGLVIWRSGSSVVLYRGISYKLKCVQTFIKQNNLDTKHVEARDYVPEDANYPKNVPKEQLSELCELNDLLDELGPRFHDWTGCAPFPVDADLLPGYVEGYRCPFRILPQGVKPCLSNTEMTEMRRLARTSPPHFALGRSRELQGLAKAMVKLWAKSAIAKIAIKRGVENTRNERMAEELKRLTRGVLVSRNKEYIVFYRGNDFMPPAVAEALTERQKEITEVLQTKEDQAREMASTRVTLTSQAKSPKTQLLAGTLAETIAASSRWAPDASSVDIEELKRESASIKRAALIRDLELRLLYGKQKLRRAERDLAKVQKDLDPSELPTDSETITEEERLLYRKIGLSMDPFLLLGRREVYDGTIENMHLHWKHRELVKVIVRGKSLPQVKHIAISLEAESGGVLVSVDKTMKGYSIILYRGKNYQMPFRLRPSNLLTRKKAFARSIELQRREALKYHVADLEERIELLKTGQVDDREPGRKSDGEEENLYLRVDESDFSSDEDESLEWESEKNETFLSLEEEEEA